MVLETKLLPHTISHDCGRYLSNFALTLHTERMIFIFRKALIFLLAFSLCMFTTAFASFDEIVTVEEQEILENFETPAEETPIEEDPVEEFVPAWELTSEEYDMLAALIWLEAGGEGYAGMQAVAEVVYNHLTDPRFPNTLHGVIYRKGAFSTAKKISSTNAPLVARVAAADVFFYGYDVVPGKPVMFCNPKYTKSFGISWSRLKWVATVKNHRFYELL